jgi:hypothetical protein
LPAAYFQLLTHPSNENEIQLSWTGARVLQKIGYRPQSNKYKSSTLKRFLPASNESILWLSWPMILLTVAVLCTPFAFVEIPPLVDVPGHTGAAAIEAAGPQSPLSRYYAWHWAFNLNMGGEVLMHLLGGDIASGWWTALLATALSVGGALACMRVLNPKGAHAMGWSLMFVFGFPWVWGFLNYLLATGMTLLAFACAQSMPPRSPFRAAILLVAQPIVLLCHAVGGLMLPILCLAASAGRVLDARKGVPRFKDARAWKDLLIEVAAECWPLLATLAVVTLWKLQAPSPDASGVFWDLHAKIGLLPEVLRDQWQPLDLVSAIASYVLILAGICFRARWTWTQGLPALAITALYIALPARIDGSQAVDARVLSVAVMLILGLQDWSRCRPALARAVAWAGGALLATRVLAITLGFLAYADDYRLQLSALDHVERGSKMFVIDENSCSDVEWRMTRRDTLGSLASVKREVWINKHWSIRGIDMLESRYDPSPSHPEYLASSVWNSRCAAPDRPGLEHVIAHVPFSHIDYLWLIGTGLPSGKIPSGTIIWRWKDSYLYRIRH